MAGESPQIRLYIDLRNALQARPEAGVWLVPVTYYRDLAAWLVGRPTPGWWWNPLADPSAFESQQRQAAAAGVQLASAVDELQSASPDLELPEEWTGPVLRAMQQVALVAGAWDEGVATMDAALAAIPGDVSETARGAVEQTGSWLEAHAGTLAVGLLVAGALGVGVVIATRRRG